MSEECIFCNQALDKSEASFYCKNCKVRYFFQFKFFDMTMQNGSIIVNIVNKRIGFFTSGNLIPVHTTNLQWIFKETAQKLHDQIMGLKAFS